MNDSLAGVVLAAGAGSRLRPLTRLRPKPLCPVGNRPLVDFALDRVGELVSSVAVNIHHGVAALDAHLPAEVHRSVEQPVALGTAGALGRLVPWIDGRDVLVTNADAWFADPLDLAGFVDGWDRTRVRLLCIEAGGAADFGSLRYCGVALMPSALASTLRAEPSGLYEACWRAEAAAGRLDLVEHPGTFVDCGTARSYLTANLLWSGGTSVIDPSAEISERAVVERSVVWDHSEVRAGEHLINTVRAGPVTVLVR